MKSQKHNQGELKKVTVTIEKDVADALEIMAKNGKMTVDDIVVIALKRYRSSHSELEGNLPRID